MPRMSGVFISYSRKDGRIATSVEQGLKELGIQVWRDQEAIYAGEKWPKAIGEAIAGNEILLLLWSDQSKDSHFVEFEWNTALALKKSIIPVFIQDIPLPAALSALNGFAVKDFENKKKTLPGLLGKPEKTDEKHTKSVLDTLSSIEHRDPAKVIEQFKATFKQKQWKVEGNVYQVSGGDIHIRNESENRTPPWMPLLLLAAILTILFFAFRTPIKAFWAGGNGSSIQLTVYVHGPQSRQEIVLENTGALIVDFDNDRRKAMIGENGRTNFGEIPAHFRGQFVGIGLEAPGYELIEPKAKWDLDGKPIYLPVKKDDSLGRIKGIVKNRNGSLLLAEATVLIGNDTMTTTNEMGIFNIVLPPHMQVKDDRTPYRLTIQKEAYEMSTEYYYPLSGDIEIRLTQ